MQKLDCFELHYECHFMLVQIHVLLQAWSLYRIVVCHLLVLKAHYTLCSLEIVAGISQSCWQSVIRLDPLCRFFHIVIAF